MATLHCCQHSLHHHCWCRKGSTTSPTSLPFSSVILATCDANLEMVNTTDAVAVVTSTYCTSLPFPVLALQLPISATRPPAPAPPSPLSALLIASSPALVQSPLSYLHLADITAFLKYCPPCKKFLTKNTLHECFTGYLPGHETLLWVALRRRMILILKELLYESQVNDVYINPCMSYLKRNKYMKDKKLWWRGSFFTV